MVVGQFNIGAIIQARLGSTRLPNKVLMPLPLNSKHCILSRIISTLNKVDFISKIYVATSNDYKNNLLEEVCHKLQINCFRGSEDDVLSRFFKIIQNNDFEFVMRFTGDNPIIDLNYLNDFIENHIDKSLDYSCSQGLPLGCNFEMIRASAIIDAYKNTTEQYDKEHVTPYIIRNSQKKEIFQFNISQKINDLRFTIDYPNDYAFMNILYCKLQDKEAYMLSDFLDILKKEPWLVQININNSQKFKLESLNEEINYILPIIKELELFRLEKYLKNDK